MVKETTWKFDCGTSCFQAEVEGRTANKFTVPLLLEE